MPRGTAYRTCAFALLLVLPIVAGAPLVLHAREQAQTVPAVEEHHQFGCLRLHDHSACTLLQRSPWAPAVPPVKIEADAPPRCTPPVSNDAASTRQPALENIQPRSPPVLN